MTYIYNLFPPRESLVSDIPAGDGNIEKLFSQCMPCQDLFFGLLGVKWLWTEQSENILKTLPLEQYKKVGI
jgi:hypothetical protein